MSNYPQRALPEAGGWRVHPSPAVLPRLSHEGPGLNRSGYDDPHGRYAVRYVAENLAGAMLETMARFRPASEAEALLASVEGVPANEDDHLDPVDGLRDWLAVQQVSRVGLAGPGGLLAVHDPELLRDLDKHPLVRAALEQSGLGTPLNRPGWTGASSDAAAQLDARYPSAQPCSPGMAARRGRARLPVAPQRR